MTRVDTSPFDLGGPTGDAALCLHGLTGTPYEVRPLGEALAREGIRARGPALPGHNATPEELAPLPYTAWLEAARAELAALRAEHPRVFAVGLSMGGLLCLALAAEGRTDAIAVVGTPLRFRPPIPQIIPLAKRIRPLLPKKEGSNICDPEARERHPSYPVMPLESVHQVIHLQRIVRDGLPQIRVPTLVAHGRHDATARLRDAREIHRRVAGSELLVLEHSAHVVPVDWDGPELAAAVSGFLKRCGGLGRSGADA